MNIVQAEGRPFFLKRGKIGCILIHGFTGVPKEMRWLGEQLAKEDYSVLGIRLFGHGTHQKDLLRARGRDWLLSLEDGYRLIGGYCDQVYLAGFSLGGILSLLFASKFPVQGVITYSTPYQFPIPQVRPFLRFIPLLAQFWRYFPKRDPDWSDMSLSEGHFEYPSYPIRGAYELHLLLTQLRSQLPILNVPVLIVHSKSDRSVGSENAQMIYDHLKNGEKSIYRLDESGHVVTCDLEREKVAQATIDFIRMVSGKETEA
jgi:carboxylesterase